MLGGTSGLQKGMRVPEAGVLSPYEPRHVLGTEPLQAPRLQGAAGGRDVSCGVRVCRLRDSMGAVNTGQAGDTPRGNSASVVKDSLIPALRRSQSRSSQATEKDFDEPLGGGAPGSPREGRAPLSAPPRGGATAGTGASEGTAASAPALWSSVQNTFWLQKEVTLQGLGQGQQGHEAKALLAK